MRLPRFRTPWIALLAAVAGCAAEPSPPHIVLVVIDALRADHLGAYGYERKTSPNLDALAAAGELFLHATAPSSWTKPSIGSLFTARYPSEHGAVSFEHDLRDELPTLAELLQQHGYTTVGVSGNFVHIKEGSGFARGFDVWRSKGVPVQRSDEDFIFTHERIPVRAMTAGEINRAVAKTLSVKRVGPLFLYVHYMDPHPGFSPPARIAERFLRDPEHHATAPPATSGYLSRLARERTTPEPPEVRRLVDLYDAEIAAVDEAIGALRRSLAEAGVEDPVLVVVADHGEELLDHGGWFHGLHLHGEVLRVPLILHDPRRRAPRVHTAPVDLLDVAPTLLGLAGVTRRTGMRGRNLLADGGARPRDLVAELHPDPLLEEHLLPRSHRFAVTRWPWKLLVHADGAREVYRLDRDPRELERLDAGAAGVPEDLALAGAILWRAPEPGAGPVDEEAREGLRALGYAE